MIGGVYLLLCVLRASSRYSNPVYNRYIDSISGRKGMNASAILTEKRKWDIADFSHWSVDFISKESEPKIKTGDGCGILWPICGAIGHSFARWMIYPGATPLLNTLLGPTLLQERNQILKSGGLRAKIQTNKNDFIDTVLYDRRNIEKDGNTLFITSKSFCLTNYVTPIT